MTQHRPPLSEQTPTPDVTEKIDRFLAADRPDPPRLVVDLNVVRAKYAALRTLFPDATLYYPKRKASESITGCARRTKADRQGLSALGYGSAQLQALARTINAPVPMSWFPQRLSISPICCRATSRSCAQGTNSSSLENLASTRSLMRLWTTR